MKGKFLNISTLTALLFLLVVPALSQQANTGNPAKEEDVDCGRYMSAYRSFFKLELYDDAFDTWWYVFSNCPSHSEMMYVDGATMYHSYIDNAPNEKVREGLIDTLLLIYDRRMEYMGGEGNVLGRKAKDLLTYRGTDIEQVQSAYDMLKKSIELQGVKSQDWVFILFTTTGITLNDADRIDDGQVIEDYFMVSEILDQLEGRSSRWTRTREAIDEMMLKENILSCESLNRYYEPQFEENKEDKAFLEKVITFYNNAGCNGTELYAKASENLYKMEHGPTSAHSLAILFITRNDYEKATSYLKEAVQGEGIEPETKAEWYYELAVVSSASEKYCEAIEYAREAIRLKSNYGKAYILLGDCYVASREKLGDDFEQRAAFWAAADKYNKAKSVDPTVADEANQKLSNYAGQFPHSEDVFFRDMKDGDTYKVGGCINESTTVRSRD